MNAKEQWIERSMASLDEAERAALSQAGRERILEKMQDAGCRMQDAGLRINGGKRSLVWKIAAAVLLLIGLNAVTMLFYGRSQSVSQESSVSSDTESFSYLDTYNL